MVNVKNLHLLGRYLPRKLWLSTPRIVAGRIHLRLQPNLYCETNPLLPVFAAPHKPILQLEFQLRCQG